MSANQNHYGSSGGKPGTRLVLNIAPIEFDRQAEVAVGFFPYEDHDQLNQLRTQYRSSHVIRRHQPPFKPDDATRPKPQIVAIPKRSDVQQVERLLEFSNLRTILGTPPLCSGITDRLSR